MNLDLEMIVKKMKRIRKISIIKRIEIVNIKQSNFDLLHISKNYNKVSP